MLAGAATTLFTSVVEQARVAQPLRDEIITSDTLLLHDVIQHGIASQWEQVLAREQTSEAPNEEMLRLAALRYIQHLSLLNRSRDERARMLAVTAPPYPEGSTPRVQEAWGAWRRKDTQRLLSLVEEARYELETDEPTPQQFARNRYESLKQREAAASAQIFWLQVTGTVLTAIGTLIVWRIKKDEA
jgi:hypothetical protein